MEYLPASMTLGEWIPVWMANYKQGTIKDTSYHQLELLARHIPDELKALPLSEILPMQLQAFYNSFAQTASKSYMDKMRGMVNSLFIDGMDNGLCEKNPARRLKVPRIAETPRESFTLEEAQLILGYIVACDNSRISTAVMTLLLTGLRRGELLGLKWDDLSNNTLTVNRSVYQKNGKPVVEENQAKTAASLRTIPLLPEVAYHIQALPKRSEFIFCTKTGAIWHPRNFSRDYSAFFKRLQEVEPSVRYLSPHACRHTFATLLNQSCSNVRTTQVFLGHTNIKTTSRYIHPSMVAMTQAVTGLRNDLTPKA